MDFQDVLNNKIADLTQERNDKQADLLRPEYHREELAQAMDNVSKQLVALDLDKEKLLNEALSLLNQIPDFAVSVWTSTMRDMKVLEEQIKKWSEMRDMYENWLAAEKDRAEAKAIALDRAKAEVKDDGAEEPSREKSIRRQPGTHPGMTLSTFRRASSELEEGEDSEE